MNEVTAQECKAVVKQTGIHWLGHHRCGGCGSMVGYSFTTETGVADSWQAELGLDGPDDIVVRFHPACGCSARGSEGELVSWSEFAYGFNMQTPEVRAKMWERFKAGRPTHEGD